MFAPPRHGDEHLPTAYNGCSCHCHRHPGVMHVMPCCSPHDEENLAQMLEIARELAEKRTQDNTK